MFGDSDGDLRVLIVADDPLVRAGLAALLADQPGLIVTGQVAGVADLDPMIAAFQPDILLWDLGWEPARETAKPERSVGLPDLEEIGVPIVVLLTDEAYAADAWLAGARGLLLRDASASVLTSALFAVARSLVVLDADLASVVLPTSDEPPGQLVEELTRRESEVLQLLALGLPNKTIAHQLGISEHTVKFHVNAIMGKLGAQSRTEAVVQATRLGLIIL